MYCSKKFSNNLRCPLCQGQIDNDFTFYCINDKRHYSAIITNESFVLEKVNIFDYKDLILYELSKDYINNSIKFSIYIRKIDAEGRILFTFDDKKIITDVNIFDFQNFNKDKALNKIKTVMLFQ